LSIDDIPETNKTPFSTSSLSNVSTTSRLEREISYNKLKIVSFRLIEHWQWEDL
jgi:hypothetical protein